MPYFYAFSAFLSAFLLFQIQPMIGKYILPWFGGTPTVWSTVLLFFQALLTGGYAYAYWLLGRVRGRRQGIVHLILLSVSLVLLLAAALTWRSPLTADTSWRPLGSDLPIWGIIRVLAVSAGFYYFLLATNSTLMQAWFNRDYPEQTPYRLYALSNTGSLLALISYPLIFEPNLTLRSQGYLWAAGYVVFAISVSYLVLRTYRRQPAAEVQPNADKRLGEDKRPSIGRHALWIGLAACASALLIAVTNQITQEVAVIPFLWILPLATYLLTYILAFSGGRGYSRPLYLIAFFVISGMSVWALVKYPAFDIITQIVIYLLLLFICCMICHNELYKLRPQPRFLPSFYLMIALGGVIGGSLATLLAPYLFPTGFWELQWGAVACGVLLAIVIQTERTAARGKRSGKARQRSAPTRWNLKPATLAIVGMTLLLSIVIILIMRSISTETLLTTRNFYGMLRVWEINTERPGVRAYELTHGKTVHGFQFESADLRDLPTAFYTKDSGVGLAIQNHPARPSPLRIGVLGLGVGVVASYGQPGDVFRFYEINPDVVNIAEQAGGYFSFLKDSPAEIQVVPGDARVSLEHELASEGSQNFDVLVLDTFNGDAMPLHLLNKEAFEIYFQHLKPNGILAINVSNRYFNLAPEVYRLADELNVGAALIEDVGDGVQSYDSTWMLLTRDQDFLKQPIIASRSAQRPPLPAGLPVWTDDFSNLLQVLRPSVN